jgi:hypothetical protein
VTKKQKLISKNGHGKSEQSLPAMAADLDLEAPPKTGRWPNYPLAPVDR